MKFVLFFLFISLIYFSCATNATLHFRNSEDFHKHIDSTSAQYQISSFNPKRNMEYIKPTLDTLATGITNVLNDIRVKSKIRAKSISFYVLPSGRFKRCNFGDFPKLDSLARNDTAFCYKREVKCYLIRFVQ